MPLLSSNQLKETLACEYTKNMLQCSREKRKANIDCFFDIPRDNLESGVVERRIFLHTTLKNEKIAIQFPGKESALAQPRPKDFRPRIFLPNNQVVPDVSFNHIWDILDFLKNKAGGEGLSYIAALLYRMQYLTDYVLDTESVPFEDIEIENGEEIVVDSGFIDFCWYKMVFQSSDVWETLNDRFGQILIGNNTEISFEAFIMMFDLLMQNEDCKYYYINTVELQNDDYKLSNGRNSTSNSGLNVLNYLQGNITLSVLLDSFNKGRGVANFKKSDYSIVTNGIVVNIDIVN